MAQLSWSKTLAQVRPPETLAARVTLTAVLSGPRLVSSPSGCQLRPPSVLVRMSMWEAAV